VQQILVKSTVSQYARRIILGLALVPTLIGAHPYSLSERDNDAKATLEAIAVPANASVLIVEPLDDRFIKSLSKHLNNKGKILLDVPASHAATYFSAKPPATANGPKITVDTAQSLLHPHAAVDLIIVDRALHRWLAHGQSESQLARLKKRLKANGHILMIDYRQDPQRPEDPKAALGYVTERLAIAKASEAGLELQDAFETNSNPHDIKDYDQGAFTLPPTLRLGSKERDRYLLIGEADRFTLYFKVANPHH